MEKNIFEKTIFTLLRVLGVLIIVGAYLGNEDFFSKNGLLIFKHKTIISNIFMISPSAIIGMIVTITIYLVFIRFIRMGRGEHVI